MLKILKSWYNKYSIEGKFTRKSVTDFISSCTNEKCDNNDDIINLLFSTYDKSN